MNSPKFWLAMLAAASCSLFGNAHADVTQADEYMKRLKIYQTVQPHGDTPFGEQVNLYTGELTFQQADIVVEGTGPTISLVRELGSSQTDDGVERAAPMGSWNLSIPYLQTMTGAPVEALPLGSPGLNWVVGPATDPNRYARCTHFKRPYPKQLLEGEWWSGIELVNERGQRQQVLLRSAQNGAQPSMTLNGQPVVFPAITAQNWQIGCLPNTSNNETGEAFFAVAPDGTKYWFDRLIGHRAQTFYEDSIGGILRQPRMRARMYVSRIEDRFGNWLTYQYSGDQLISIAASDGRSVSLQWRADSPVIERITVQPGPQQRVWHYEYSEVTATNAKLSAVVLPDQSRWVFSTAIGSGGPMTDSNLSKCTTRTLPNPAGSSTMTMTHPSGLTGEFTVAGIWHARSYVPSYCKHPVYPQEFEPYEVMPPLFGTGSLIQKQFSGPGLTTQTWSYAYSAAQGSTVSDACAASNTCPDTVWVDVVGPDGNRTRYTHSNRFDETEGKLLRTDIYQGASSLLRSESLGYALSTSGPYPALLGGTMVEGVYNGIKDSTWTPLRQRSIVQQGVSFVWQANSFDTFANPLSTTRSSTLGYTRTDVSTYFHDTAKWVIGLSASSTNTDSGLVESQTDYWPATALPQRVWSFGKARQYLEYNADGTLAKVLDGNNHATLFANWKRGIPQTITFADTKFKSAAVNDYGLIDSVTDENGFITKYGYDAMGRMTLVDYPDGDTVAWASRSFVFEQINAFEHGIPAGHWRRLESLGNYRKYTYFDALWRPILAHEFDDANLYGTLRTTATAYDAEGRTTFASYPGSSSVAPGTGVWTTYDALGRATLVQQNSELGVLNTTTEYLPNFRTRTTTPGGSQTTTDYMAFDQPTTEWPHVIAHPEGAYTDITLDLFGKPRWLTRRNASSSLAATRTYVYDAYQQLCKTIDPETGSTAMGYDNAGNLAWSASGLALPSTNCDAASVPVAATVSRTYDARDRIRTLTFPDNLGNQSWTYAADGLPISVTTLNSGNTPVINNYAYNKRRLLESENIAQPGLYSWTTSYGYNVYGHLNTMAYPSGHGVYFLPNALGQPSRVATYVTDVSYFPNGAIRQFTYGNGIVHTLTQNARQLPDTSCDFYGSCGAGAALNDGYDYDLHGNVLAISDGTTGGRGNRNMTYDGLDRLKYVASPMYGTIGANYSYDVLDNLTRVNIGGTAMRDHYYCYDAQWRLTNVKTGSCGGTTVIGLGYDAQGNLANKNGQQYQFDFGNRLREAVGQESYRYDGHGRRAQATTPAGSIFSQYSQGGQLLYQVDERSNKDSVYFYLGGSLVATLKLWSGGYAMEYQHTDALGSPVAVTDANRVVIEKSEYEPYGGLLNRPIKDGPGYTGHVSDAATGLSYMQQRYYDPMLAGGRFLSVDPVTATSLGGNFNRYWYANNNPYKFKDPDGREAACFSNGNPSCGVSGENFRQNIVVIADALEFVDREILTPLGPAGLPEKAVVLPMIRLLKPLATEARAVSAMARGRAAEARVLAEMGLAKNTTKVATAEGKAIPDALTSTLSVEIKDAAKVSLTRQARIETGAAKAAGQQSVLVTGAKTCVSGNCEKAYDQVIRRTDLGPQN